MKFFQKKSIGLDIADHTIEVAELEKSGSKVRVVSLGRAKLTPGVVERGRIKEEKRLMAAVRDVFLKAKPEVIAPDRLTFGIPESQVYTHVFTVNTKGKKLKESELDALVQKEAQRNIPLGRDSLLYTYKSFVSKKDVQKIDVFFMATSKEVVLEWQKFFKKLNIAVEAFDSESLAVRRALLFDFFDRETGVMVVDIGAATSNISIFDERGILRYSYSVPIAGEAMTQELVASLKIKEDEAEQLKIKQGVASPGEKTSAILIKVLESIAKEIKTSIGYFKRRTGKEVKEIILVGGSSQLKGLIDYFSSNLNLRVKVGEPFLKAKEGVGERTGIDLQNSQPSSSQLFHIEAIGLALRGLDKKWDKKDPAINIEAKKHDNIRKTGGKSVGGKELVQDISPSPKQDQVLSNTR